MIAGVLLFLCVVLFVAVIVMAICWPRVEDYMLEDVCVDKDCIDASAQVRLGSFKVCLFELFRFF